MNAKVRVSATVRGYIEGSGAYQQPEAYRESGDGDMAALASRIMDETPADRRGVAVVDCDTNEVGILHEWAEMMAISALDDASFDNPSMLGDLNAARALLRQLEALGRWELHEVDGRNVKVWVATEETP